MRWIYEKKYVSNNEKGVNNQFNFYYQKKRGVITVRLAAKFIEVYFV